MLDRSGEDFGKLFAMKDLEISEWSRHLRLTAPPQMARTAARPALNTVWCGIDVGVHDCAMTGEVRRRGSLEIGEP